MKFRFSGNKLTGRERKLQRFFEIAPGATSWTIIIGMVIVSFVSPLAAAVIIIAFDLYWLLRLLSMTFFLVLSYYSLAADEASDWMERVRGLDQLDRYLEELNRRPLAGSIKDKVSLYFHREDVRSIKAHAGGLPPSKDIYHLVIIPVVSETRDIVEPGVKSLIEGTFTSERIFVIFALEERADEKVKAGIRKIRDTYKHSFFDMLIAVHESLIVHFRDEIYGKVCIVTGKAF